MSDSVGNHSKAKRKEETVDSEKHWTGMQEQTSEDGVGSVPFDPHRYYDEQAGRLVVSPEEARAEFGPKVADQLKLSRDGTKVLWPQPTDDPRDPMNWTDRQKALQLFIVTLAAIVPDFDSSIGIASLFKLAATYDTTVAHINNLTSNWSIFLLGWGGIFAVMLMRRYGRLPALFWSQLLALAFLVGATFSPNLSSFAAFRCLTAFFGTCPQVTGLYIVTDMYPFHVQARKINLWTMGFIASPFLGPFALGFLVARTGSWRWAYGTGCLYGAVVLALIVFFGRETIYDRHLKNPPAQSSLGWKHRIETLVGITGAKMAKHRATWREVIWAPLNVIWRPQILGILIFEGMLFGFGIGINVTNAVFLGEPEPAGFGLSPYAVAGMYATPIVGVVIGELIGRYANDAILELSVRRNHGIFEAESRLWACYIALPLYACGFLVLGAAFQNHSLGLGAVIMGWGIAQVAIMVNTVAVYAYCNDCFPRHQGEISGLINLVRTLGGFAVAYFQVPWAEEHGALQTLGVEAAIVVGLFLIFVPYVQLRGRSLRARYGLR